VTAGPRVLGTTLDARFVPGANRGHAETENWLYLLPTLDLGHVVCLGVPNAVRLRSLSKASERVTVLGPRHQLQERRAVRRAGGASNVEFRADPPPVTAADAVVISGRWGQRTFERTRSLWLRSDPQPAIFRELRRLHLTADTGRATAGAATGENVWLRPPIGPVHAAAPLRDGESIRFLQDGRFDRRAGDGTVRRKVLRRVLDHEAVRGRLLRQGVLTSTSARGLPHYVRAAAAEAGLDLDGRRWAMAAPGRYRSKKVIFFVFEGEGPIVSEVIKLTRHPELNHRLENEWRSLTHLSAAGVHGFPEPTFLGHHAGLALLGQRALNGSPLRPSRGADGLARSEQGAARLEDLAAATAHHVPSTVVADALEEILRRFEDLYGPRAWLVTLHDHVEAIRAHADPLPLVFQHGDPGAWNALATTDGGVTFLDWEAGDPSGLPLWDLLYFMRSFGVAAERTEGRRDALEAFTRVYLEPSPLSEQLVTSVRAYCTRLRLDPALVEPLYHLCWAHRAVKEATRLPADRLGSGHYVRLLELGLQHRAAPGLRELFAIGRADLPR
jgi:hypothetical protein